MNWQYPWDFVRHIESSRRASFGLTADRKAFFIRGVRSMSDLAPAELEYIRANRDRVLQHVQHLLPPPEFIRQRDLGWPGFKPQPKSRFQHDESADSRSEQNGQVDTSKVPF